MRSIVAVAVWLSSGKVLQPRCMLSAQVYNLVRNQFGSVIVPPSKAHDHALEVGLINVFDRLAVAIWSAPIEQIDLCRRLWRRSQYPLTPLANAVL